MNKASFGTKMGAMFRNFIAVLFGVLLALLAYDTIKNSGLISTAHAANARAYSYETAPRQHRHARRIERLQESPAIDSIDLSDVEDMGKTSRYWLVQTLGN